jgi:alpha-D-ribose 1-methylphosphonate 5-triphosphate synthase subunit PhnH
MLGTLSSPEKSATIIVKVVSLEGGETALRLTGPGIRDSVECSLAGLDADWLRQRESWCCAFPLGVDLILVDQQRVVALPRSTRVEVR